MDPKVFLQNACPLCGTQRCYGQEEDLEHCGMWKTVKDLPNKAAMKAIQIAAHNPYKTVVDVVRDLGEESSQTAKDSPRIMSDNEMHEFIVSVGRPELLDELEDILTSNKPNVSQSKYLKAVRASLLTLGYDSNWVEGAFRTALETHYSQLLGCK